MANSELVDGNRFMNHCSDNKDRLIGLHRNRNECHKEAFDGREIRKLLRRLNELKQRD